LVISLTSPLSSDGALTLSYTPPANNALQDADGNRLASLSRSLGQVKTGTAAADTLSGQAALSDYFLGSAGNDSYSGLGGADTWVWPDFGAGGPGGFVQTIKDFGFKKGSGTLQGSSEADLLDLRQLLDGYTAASTIADFLRFDKNADNKLVLNIDRDGGTEGAVALVANRLASEELRTGAGEFLCGQPVGGKILNLRAHFLGDGIDHHHAAVRIHLAAIELPVLSPEEAVGFARRIEPGFHGLLRQLGAGCRQATSGNLPDMDLGGAEIAEVDVPLGIGGRTFGERESFGEDPRFRFSLHEVGQRVGLSGQR
jgi:hypothetical protein